MNIKMAKTKANPKGLPMRRTKPYENPKTKAKRKNYYEELLNAREAPTSILKTREKQKPEDLRMRLRKKVTFQE
mgnify:CR=1 FL=1